MSKVYDKLDWHYESALNAGQPGERGFTHIALYLAWLIRHDLHDHDLIRDDWAEMVKGGQMKGSDLADAIDGKLVSEAMSPEGKAFSDAYYKTYVKDYGEAFASVPDYSVPDDATTYERVASLIDRRYATWVEDGRPVSPSQHAAEVPFESEDTVAFHREGALNEEGLVGVEQVLVRSGYRLERPVGVDLMPHEARDLEDLLPRHLTDPPMETWSGRASQFASSLVKRALKRLAVRPRDAYVVSGMGRKDLHTVTADIYAVPGADAMRLDEEFKTAIHLPTNGWWTPREVAGRKVYWANGLEFIAAYWTLDGLVLHVTATGGDAELVERAIGQLP